MVVRRRPSSPKGVETRRSDEEIVSNPSTGVRGWAAWPASFDTTASDMTSGTVASGALVATAKFSRTNTPGGIGPFVVEYTSARQ